MSGKKIVLDLDPQGPITFTRSINIPTGDGKPLAVDFDFLFRDRVEYAKLSKSWSDESKVKAEAIKTTDSADDSFVEWAESEIAIQVQMLMQILTGWGIGNFEFNAENLARFIRRYPGAFLALIRDYREGMTEGRLGN